MDEEIEWVDINTDGEADRANRYGDDSSENSTSGGDDNVKE